MYNPIPKLQDKLIADSDRCVMCGLCLPHCPTFNIKRNEADSPRGRILLTKALAKQELLADKHVRRHLESCLHCLHCERVCPAEVPFGELIDNAKYCLHQQQQTTPLPLWLRLLIASRGLRFLFALLISLYQRWGLQVWLRNQAFFRRLTVASQDAMLAKRIDMPIMKASAKPKHKTVTLFSGCVAAVCDQNTLKATQQLLYVAGFNVKPNNKQGCCGAIHQHTGNLEYAQHLMHKNSKAFSSPDIPVISCASGCGARLQQYDGKLPAYHYDIHAFLLKYTKHLRFKELSQTVALHTPCSMQNILKEQEKPKELLNLMPNLHIVSLASETNCCGAAGIQILQQQSQGNALADGTIDAMKKSGADILLTSNVGCAIHLRRRIWQRKLSYEVMHPILLLYKQLATPK